MCKSEQTLGSITKWIVQLFCDLAAFKEKSEKFKILLFKIDCWFICQKFGLEKVIPDIRRDKIAKMGVLYAKKYIGLNKVHHCW